MKRIFSFLIAVVLSLSTAFATTVYCKMTYDWWTTGGAAIAVHYWGGSSTGTTWPGIRMNYVAGDENVWSCDVPADVTAFMFVRVNGSGDVSDWGAKTEDLTFQDGKDLYTITSSTASWGDNKVTGEWSKYEAPIVPVVHTYTIAGNSTELFGQQWKEADELNDMELVDDLYVWSKADVTLPETTVKFKVCQDHAWTHAWPESDYALAIAKSGIYDVTITFNADTKDITATATLKKEEIVLPVIAFASGEYNEWSATADVLVNAPDSLSASTTIHIVNAGDYEFKMVKDGNWLSLNGQDDSQYVFHRNHTAVAQVVGVDLHDMILRADKAGDYIIKWVYANDSINITYPDLDAYDVTISSSAHVSISVKVGETPIGAKVDEFTELTITASVTDASYRVKNLRAYKTDTEEPLEIGEGGKLTMPSCPITIAAEEGAHVEDGFYIVGTFDGVAAWDLDDMNSSKRFVVNPDNNEEYKLMMDLKVGDSFKVRNVVNDAFLYYYPDGIDNDYVVDSYHYGNGKTIYFRPNGDGGEGWHHGVIYIDKNDPTAVDNTDAAVKAVKTLENGQLIIEKNGKRYDVFGNAVK